MADASPIQTSFNAGELGRRLEGRTDLAAYGSGAAEMLNVVPLVQGPALKRSGTRLVALAKSQTTAGWLIPFTASVTQGYVIEASNFAFRFYTNDGRVEIAGVPVTVTTPYATADLAGLDWHQSNDVLYLTDGLRSPRKLSRTAADAFNLAVLPLKDGPFADLNSDESVTVYASAGTGSVTLTASSSIFTAGHVGALFYLEVGDFRDIPAWEPGVSVTVGALRRSDGNVYKAIALPAAGGRTGSVAPIHTSGRERDGMASGTDVNAKDAGGVLWEYQYGRFGIATITAQAGTTATATVTTTLPDNVVGSGNASWRWAFGAFSDAAGWPSCVTIWNERLIYAQVNGLYASVVGDYANFAARNDAGELTADQALQYKLPTSDAIQWLAGDRQLLAGTAAKEYALGAVNPQLAVSQTNVNAPVQSFHGSSKVRPVQAGKATLFVQRAGKKLREAGYDLQADRYTAPDLTTRHPAIGRPRIVQLAFQQEPQPIVWALRADGVLLSFTYSDEQEVRGWSRHVLGGVSDAAGTPAAVESIAVIPSPDGGEDDLWLLVRRWVNGAPLRTVERMESFWEEGDAVADGFFIDCGLSYSGAPVTTLSGLSHLAGETVKLLVDGATHPDLTVSGGGTVTLANGVAGSKIHVGLGFTARLTTMRLEAGSRSGTGQGKIKRITNSIVRVLETLGLYAGPAGGRLDAQSRRRPSDPMDSAPPAFSGDIKVQMSGGWDRDAQSTYESRDPLPMCILAAIPDVQAGEP